MLSSLQAIASRLFSLGPILVLAACGVTAYEIPGEAEDPRKFKRNVEQCRSQRAVSFDQCMANRGYVARPYRPGDRKTLWLPTNKAKVTTPQAMRSCGGRETLDQVAEVPGDPIVFFDCMKARGFEPKTVDGDAFTPIVFLNERKSAAQHKVDYGLCGADFANESVVPADLYSNPNHPMIRCLLSRGYRGVAITDRTRVRWMSSSQGALASSNEILSCGAVSKLGEVVIRQSRLSAVAVCMEERGYRYQVLPAGGSGYRVIAS